MSIFTCRNFLFLHAVFFLYFLRTEQYSVVIIGAGSAGLATATRLLEKNFTDIKILEALDRIGGRVNSVPFGEAIVELGAEWCHGEVGNVVHEMVKDLDMLEDPGSGMNTAFSNGKLIDSNRSIAMLNLLETVSDNVDEQFVNSSIGEYLSEAIPAALKQRFHDDEETLNLALQSVGLFEKYVLLLESAFSWDNISASGSYENCEGKNLAWKGKGYNQIFDVMSKKVPKSFGPILPVQDKIDFKKTVSKIDYSTAKPVVTCTDGSKYTSDYVVFTPSLGVLKHDHKSLFHPPLSKDKVSAINDLGIGAVIKVLQYYKDIWWPSDLVFGFSFSWMAEDDEEAAKLFAHGPIKNGKSWVSGITSMLPAEHNPHVVYIWITGPSVPEIEKLSDNDVEKGISYVLNKFLGQNYQITKPGKMLRYGWYTNPHFRGTYSYDSIHSKRQGDSCRVILAKPEKNSNGKEVLLFAGEATNKIHAGTVHGAIETGHREADRILSASRWNIIF